MYATNEKTKMETREWLVFFAFPNKHVYIFGVSSALRFFGTDRSTLKTSNFPRRSFIHSSGNVLSIRLGQTRWVRMGWDGKVPVPYGWVVEPTFCSKCSSQKLEKWSPRKVTAKTKTFERNQDWNNWPHAGAMLLFFFLCFLLGKKVVTCAHHVPPNIRTYSTCLTHVKKTESKDYESWSRQNCPLKAALSCLGSYFWWVAHR